MIGRNTTTADLFGILDNAKQSILGNIVASYLLPQERSILEKFIQRQLPKSSSCSSYRNVWGANAYNAVFVHLGAGYNDIDYRVTVPAAMAIDCLTCHPNLNSTCSYQACCVETTQELPYYVNFWYEGSRDDYVGNKAGIRFPDNVNENQLINDVVLNYVKSFLMTPVVSFCGYGNFLANLLCCQSCSTDYSRYTEAPAMYMPDPIGYDPHKKGVGVARYRGYTDYKYNTNSNGCCKCCCDDCSGCCFNCNNCGIVTNDICADFVNCIGLPFANVCCSTAMCCFGYALGSAVDCASSTKPIETRLDDEITIISPQIELVRWHLKPTPELLRKWCMQHAYVRYDHIVSLPRSSYLFYVDRTRCINLNLRDVSFGEFDLIMAFESEPQSKCLSAAELGFITRVTGHVLPDVRQKELKQHEISNIAAQAKQQEDNFHRQMQLHKDRKNQVTRMSMLRDDKEDLSLLNSMSTLRDVKEDLPPSKVNGQFFVPSEAIHKQSDGVSKKAIFRYQG